jgi:hypothetical protein
MGHLLRGSVQVDYGSDDCRRASAWRLHPLGADDGSCRSRVRERFRRLAGDERGRELGDQRQRAAGGQGAKTRSAAALLGCRLGRGVILLVRACPVLVPEDRSFVMRAGVPTRYRGSRVVRAARVVDVPHGRDEQRHAGDDERRQPLGDRSRPDQHRHRRGWRSRSPVGGRTVPVDETCVVLRRGPDLVPWSKEAGRILRGRLNAGRTWPVGGAAVHPTLRQEQRGSCFDMAT